MIRVIVVDDHPIVLEGLKRVISQESNMAVVGEAPNGDAAIEVVSRSACDVVLVDLFMPEKNGLDVLKDIHSRKPRLPVLLMSGHADDEYAIRCLRAGAAGYLHKETAIAEVSGAIRKVVRGEKYVTDRIAQKLLLSLTSESRLPHQDLSDREYQVFFMLASGKPVKQIARELSLSVKTVSTYRLRVMEKLNLENNAELMHYAFKEGIVS